VLAQLQVYWFFPFVHVPCAQGLAAHSSISTSQLAPVAPVPVQSQVRDAPASVHTPPFEHGVCAQFWIRVSQSSPV
jgi:hypothetical protein